MGNQLFERHRFEPESPESKDLSAAVDQFCQRQKADRDPEDLCLELTWLRRLIDRLALEFSQTAAAFTATDEWDLQGSASPIDWIRHNCNMGSGTSVDRVRVGEQLAKMPGSVDAVIAGQIGFAHLSMMASTASSMAESQPDRPFDETAMLEKARQSSVSRFWHFCQKVRHSLDPVGFNAEQVEATQARGASIRELPRSRRRAGCKPPPGVPPASGPGRRLRLRRDWPTPRRSLPNVSTRRIARASTNRCRGNWCMATFGTTTSCFGQTA